ncbi:MAG TPA: AAA family ATPase [Steroidobacteraceae bacterium]|nr:AAA family ATPase [Steroidobacteraceae bacterium]
MADTVPTIAVLAGTNGAGKSSIGGAMLESAGAPFFNPDRETRALMAGNPGMPLPEANAQAWRIGRDRLAEAIANRQSFNFETTLGGTTIARMLADAHKSGLRVRMWYCGLRDVDLHRSRVQARVSRGGHDIPEAKIRERFDASRNNLCTLLPSLDELLLYDNSIEADPNDAQAPRPVRLLHYRDGRVLFCAASMPDWAKPIVALSLAQRALPAASAHHEKD